MITTSSNDPERARAVKLVKKILICVVRNRGVDLDKLTMTTSLNRDLGLDGDDVDDLWEDIDKYVRIDWSSWNFKEYFYEEGISFGNALVLFIRFPVILSFALIKKIFRWMRVSVNVDLFQSSYFKEEKKDFKIGHLIAAAYSGKWENTFMDSISVEKEIQDWQIRYWDRFKRRYKLRNKNLSY
ncbi:DUF1493 family protein [Leptospira alstonii]|uniref:PF07377 family protein n=2 Tax=Leptospira alstonii TaxID=28452 RepID=M6D100_9LEPT|nr:DUF1493 family protein [Leptospira alstonii]EMJ97822.1 PF07377 family protein [Leptospira alstonii serovar Sichuan str. 79601]EQA80270.1 PF07377 family protein [Leptospira alstonii serovar Pingchang str. 80-412]